MQQKARLGKQRYSEYRGNPQSFPEGQQLGEGGAATTQEAARVKPVAKLRMVLCRTIVRIIFCQRRLSEMREEGRNRLWAETERWMIVDVMFLLPASHLIEKKVTQWR